MGTCPNNGVNIPPSQTEPCSGKYYDDNCVIHPQALTEFNLPPDSSVNTIIEAYKTSIANMQQRLSDLESGVIIVEGIADGTETKVEGGTNTTVTGTGAELDPYIINNTAPDQIVSIVGAGSTAVTGTYPNFTVTTPTVVAPYKVYTAIVRSVSSVLTTTVLENTIGAITVTGNLSSFTATLVGAFPLNKTFLTITCMHGGEDNLVVGNVDKIGKTINTIPFRTENDDDSTEMYIEIRVYN